MLKNKDVTVRKVGRQYMVVKHSETNVDLSTVYTMNATAAYLWEQAGDKEFTIDMLVEWLCEKYEVEPATALPDIKRLVEEWKKLGMVF